jgi:chemotaxis protein MotA
MFREAFREADPKAARESLNEVVDCARLVRKESLMALEKKIPTLKDPFVARIARNVVDGLDPNFIREIFEAEIDSEQEEMQAAAKVWADAGGFAPTIGIIGAVLGLIHVMGNLSDTSKLGAGIAVAFVATVYGVSFANLLFIPIGNKLKKKISRHVKERHAILEGSLLINSMLNPLVIEQKIKASMEAPDRA